MHYIYTIHNIINNKIYVGKSQDPIKRWKKHITVAQCKRKREKYFLHRAIQKYGKHNFIFSIIQNFQSEQDCTTAEIYWINYFQSNNSKLGYNLTVGGEGVSGRICNEETKNKIRLKAIGRKHTKKTKNKLRILNTGKILSLETIEKTASKLRGRKLNTERRLIISESTKGICKTLEHKQKISKSKKGKFVGEKNPSAKISQYEVINIRNKYKTGYTKAQLAREYKIGRTTIRRIINKESWKHI